MAFDAYTINPLKAFIMIPIGVGPDLPDSLLRAHRSRGAPCVTGDHGQNNVILSFVKNFYKDFAHNFYHLICQIPQTFCSHHISPCFSACRVLGGHQPRKHHDSLPAGPTPRILQVAPLLN